LSVQKDEAYPPDKDVGVTPLPRNKSAVFTLTSRVVANTVDVTPERELLFQAATWAKLLL
jgi:hypothetical protein